MKHSKKDKRRDLDDNSEDERVKEPPVNDATDDDFEEEDDFFENSQELTQIIPRKSDKNRNGEETSPPKKKKKEREEERRESSTSPSPEPESRLYNGYRVREMDVSEIPAHIISNMRRVLPKESDCSSGLTVEAVQKAGSSSNGGVWILKCPRDVNLSDLLPGKKLSLDGGQSEIDMDDDEEDAQLTQFVPTNALGANIKYRQFETTTVVNDAYKDGAVLLLPDADKYKLVAAPVQGHIIIRECVKELQFPKIKPPVSKPRKLPEGIKERHPVYGADFSKIVDEMESAPKKKRKKSHHDPSTTQDYVNGHVNAFPPLPATIIPKIEIESDDSNHRTKKKKKKERQDQDNVDNSFTRQNGYEKSSAFTHSLDENCSDMKKKSKKRKREEMDDSYHDVDQTVLLEVSEPSSKKLKKSKRMSLV